MPPTTPTPTSPGGPKQMPKWAWPVAIGGGLLIGFFFLRKGPEEYEEQAAEESPYPDVRKPGGGGGGGLPFDDSVLEAFGLTPPTSEFQGSGTGDGGSFDSGEATAATSDGTQTSLASQLPSSLFYNPSTPAYQQAPSSFFQPPSSTPIFTQAPAGSLPVPSGSSEPTASGTGSRSNLAQ